MFKYLVDTEIVSVAILVQVVRHFLQSHEKCQGYEPETVAEATSTCEIGQATSHIARTAIERTTSNKISVCQCEQANPGQIQGGGEASSSGHERHTDQAEGRIRKAIACSSGGTQEATA